MAKGADSTSNIQHRTTNIQAPVPGDLCGSTHKTFSAISEDLWFSAYTNHRYVSVYMRQTIWFQVSVFRCQEDLKPDTRNLLRKTEIIPIRSSVWYYTAATFLLPPSLHKSRRFQGGFGLGNVVGGIDAESGVVGGENGHAASDIERT